jgi:hypothetical protein
MSKPARGGCTFEHVRVKGEREKVRPKPELALRTTLLMILVRLLRRSIISLVTCQAISLKIDCSDCSCVRYSPDAKSVVPVPK